MHIPRFGGHWYTPYLFAISILIISEPLTVDQPTALPADNFPCSSEEIHIALWLAKIPLDFLLLFVFTVQIFSVLMTGRPKI